MSADLEATAERAWRRFSNHCQGCPVCSPAGGEDALPTDLCRIGQMLGDQWAIAEDRAAQAVAAERFAESRVG